MMDKLDALVVFTMLCAGVLVLYLVIGGRK